MTQRENMELIFQHKMPEWIPHFRNDTYGFIDEIIERPLFTTGRDAWGCNWISCEASLNITHPDTSDYKFTEVVNWRENITIPDLESIDFTPVIEATRDFTDRKSKMLSYISLNGIFERTHVLMGFENALTEALEEPEMFGSLLEALADHKIRLIKKIYDICHPEILNYHDDMGTQFSQFFATSFYKEYLFPQYKRIVDAAREIGYKYVIHHSCGKIEELIPDWIACGFDGWDSVMPCNNLEKLKKEYGDKIVFLPGMDTQKVLGNKNSTRTDIEKMIVRYMNMLACDGTGLIIDSSTSYSLNPTNEAISLECIQKHGKPFMDAKKAGIKYIPDYE